MGEAVVGKFEELRVLSTTRAIPTKNISTAPMIGARWRSLEKSSSVLGYWPVAPNAIDCMKLSAINNATKLEYAKIQQNSKPQPCARQTNL